MRRIDEQTLAPDERDEFQALLLGAVSLFARLDRLLKREAARDPAPHREPEDAALLAALGWISLQRSFERWISEAIVPPPDETAATQASRLAHRAGWLR
jgi:hypothetical protein